MNISRRNMLMGSAAVVSPVVLAACSQQNVDVIKTVTDFINAVQQGVSDAIKTACNTATAYIVIPDTILAIAAQILQTTAIVSGNLADAVKNLQQIIDAIVAAGCPTPAPAPSPTGAFKGVPVRFYS
jgi:hypothetical protein